MINCDRECNKCTHASCMADEFEFKKNRFQIRRPEVKFNLNKFNQEEYIRRSTIRYYNNYEY